jgi:anti-sigma B factor antagonist
MRIIQRQRDGVTVLDCSGKLSVDDGDKKLRETVEALIEGGETAIILNLRGVVSVDSSGLGEMVATKTSAAARGTTIKLLHLEDKVRQVVAMTHLVGVFETFDDESAAIESFRT